MRLSRRDRLAAWFLTGRLGRLLAFLLDVATMFTWALASGIRRLLRMPPP
jgi:hypothetical protein